MKWESLSLAVCLAVVGIALAQCIPTATTQTPDT